MESQTASDAELRLLRVIWGEGGSALFARIMEALGEQGRGWNKNTVLTLLARLVDKGMLSVRKAGRRNIYTALVGEADYLGAQAETFVGRLYEGDARGLVAALIRQDLITRDDMEELERFWMGGDHE